MIPTSQNPFLGTLTWLSVPKDTYRAAQNYTNNGQSAHALATYHMAYRICEETVRIAPKRADVFDLLSRIFDATGDSTPFRITCEEAVEISQQMKHTTRHEAKKMAFLHRFSNKSGQIP